jgi:hypothetical protein
MDDRSISVPRRAVVRLCESSRFQRQFLAQAYRQVFPEVRRALGDPNVRAKPCGSPARNSTAARVAAGA